MFRHIPPSRYTIVRFGGNWQTHCPKSSMGKLNPKTGANIHNQSKRKPNPKSSTKWNASCATDSINEMPKPSKRLLGKRGLSSEERRVGQVRFSRDWSSDVCSSDLIVRFGGNWQTQCPKSSMGKLNPKTGANIHNQSKRKPNPKSSTKWNASCATDSINEMPKPSKRVLGKRGLRL